MHAQKIDRIGEALQHLMKRNAACALVSAESTEAGGKRDSARWALKRFSLTPFFIMAKSPF
ncbi:MAG: hypothetical protein OEY18_09480 [Candidatus Aminicenantes bacterium]|nr:hypothetical protein [Candidatus Aminicenantes bacterium]